MTKVSASSFARSLLTPGALGGVGALGDGAAGALGDVAAGALGDGAIAALRAGHDGLAEALFAARGDERWDACLELLDRAFPVSFRAPRELERHVARTVADQPRTKGIFDPRAADLVWSIEGSMYSSKSARARWEVLAGWLDRVLAKLAATAREAAADPRMRHGVRLELERNGLCTHPSVADLREHVTAGAVADALMATLVATLRLGTIESYHINDILPCSSSLGRHALLAAMRPPSGADDPNATGWLRAVALLVSDAIDAALEEEELLDAAAYGARKIPAGPHAPPAGSPQRATRSPPSAGTTPKTARSWDDDAAWDAASVAASAVKPAVEAAEGAARAAESAAVDALFNVCEKTVDGAVPTKELVARATELLSHQSPLQGQRSPNVRGFVAAAADVDGRPLDRTVDLSTFRSLMGVAEESAGPTADDEDGGQSPRGRPSPIRLPSSPRSPNRPRSPRSPRTPRSEATFSLRDVVSVYDDGADGSDPERLVASRSPTLDLELDAFASMEAATRTQGM